MVSRELISLTFVAAIFFAVTVTLPRLNPQVEVKYLNPPPEMIEYFQFGFKDSVADSLWLRWIQDSDYCQTYLLPVEILEPETVFADPLLANPRHRKCDNSWSFKMLDSITKLAPKFQMPYLTGGMSLSVLVEDFEGATVIFDRAVENFPNDWNILYRAAYHFLYDKQDLPKAADLMNRAAQLGGPPWLSSLAARLYSRSGQLVLGIQSLKTYREVFKTEEDRAAITKRINELEAQLAKEQPK